MREQRGGAGTVVSINLGNFGSTGGIVRGVAQVARASGFRCYAAFPPTKHNRTPYEESDILIGRYWPQYLWANLDQFIGMNGCYSFFATLRFLRRLDQLEPDIVHLHNVHYSFIHLPLLFRYLKKHGIAVVWTLHDCWAFTGHCAYFTMSDCEKWRTRCFDCPCLNEYPATKADHSRALYGLKRKWFCGVPRMMLVTPSRWLAGLAAQSFLREYPVMAIHNGIDPAVFRPTESDFRAAHGLTDRFMLLGVAFFWDKRKGLDAFATLAERLGARYQIVLVGTTEETKAAVPASILCIDRTADRQELAALYTAADLFVNPTREENYPTVNMEALSCGTPVITFDTGGSAEIADETCGMTVPWNDVDALERGIRDICENGRFSKEACLLRARAFDERAAYTQYIELYERMMRGPETERNV